MSISCSTVRSRRFLSAAEAVGWLPHRRQVLAQREQPVALLVAERDPTARQRGALGFHLRDMDEGVMPAPFSCSRHQTVVRIDPIIVPSGPLDLVTRLLQGSC